jgi:hypothetical protein
MEFFSSLVLGRVHRQLNGEDAASAFEVLHIDRAPLGLHSALYDRQAQAQPGPIFVGSPDTLVEAAWVDVAWF